MSLSIYRVWHGVNKQAALPNTGSFIKSRSSGHSLAPTKVQYLDRLEESVLAAEVLHRPLATVVLDVREAAGPKYVVIAVTRRPIEVWHSPLIVRYVGVPDKVRSPRGLAGLQ